MKNRLLILLAFFVMAQACNDDDSVEVRPEALSDFSLLSPADNTSLTLNSGTPDATLTITWEASKAGLNSPVTYAWLVDEVGGDFSSPLVTLSADEDGVATQLTLTQKGLDDALASVGVGAGQETSLQWTIRADNGTFQKTARTAFGIKIRRFGDGLKTFSLLSPASGTTLQLDKDQFNSEVSITWEAAEVVGAGTVTYQWLAVAAGGSFDNPALSLDSDNNGTDPSLTLTQEALNNALVDLGVGVNGSIDLDWTVVAKAGDFSTMADESFAITINRPIEGVFVTFRLNDGASIPDGFTPYLGGEWATLGVVDSDWQEPGTNPDLQMTFNTGESRWEKTFVVPFDKDGTTIEYKYFLVPDGGTSWNNGEESFSAADCQGLANGAEGTSNRLFTFNSGDQSAQDISGTVVTWEGFCRDTDKDRVRFVVNVPASTPSSEDIYLTGNIGVLTWQQPGRAAGMRMAATGVANQFEVFLPMSQDQTVEFKFFLATTKNPRWNGGEQQFTVGNDGCEGRPNRFFTYDGSNSPAEFTVVSWEGLCPL